MTEMQNKLKLMKKLLLIVFLVAFGLSQLFADTVVGSTGNGSANPNQTATATLAKHHKKKHHRRRHRRHHRRRRHHKKKLTVTTSTPAAPAAPAAPATSRPPRTIVK